MEQDNQEIQLSEQIDMEKPEGRFIKKDANIFLAASILVSSLMVSAAWAYTSTIKADRSRRPSAATTSSLKNDTSVSIPVKWDDLGARMVKDGVIKKEALLAIYKAQGGTDGDSLLSSDYKGGFTMTQANSGYILNLLWAFGLANNNRILTQGPMVDPRYGGAANFASTGGWTLAEGGAMKHYAKHNYVDLSYDQQGLVEEVSKNIYRPCCDNSTYFPDCNHGMAMLGLLELMAAQGATADQMYRTALQVNSFWFPDTYQAIAKYFQSQGTDLRSVDPKTILSSTYSSASGYRSILQNLGPQTGSTGSGGCGVN